MCNSLYLFCTQIQRRAEQVLRNSTGYVRHSPEQLRAAFRKISAPGLPSELPPVKKESQEPEQLTGCASSVLWFLCRAFLLSHQ